MSTRTRRPFLATARLLPEVALFSTPFLCVFTLKDIISVGSYKLGVYSFVLELFVTDIVTIHLPANLPNLLGFGYFSSDALNISYF